LRKRAVAFAGDDSLVITVDSDNVIRVGPVTGEEPHLLLGQEGPITRLAVDPKGRWIASGGNDGTIFLWPFPKGRPFHSLERDEFLERLQALTNLRAVRDESSDGYTIEIGDFPGWEDAPTW
jgi:WD40 repeat protein